jgi:hypothetical protein
MGSSKQLWHIIITTLCPICRARAGELCAWLGPIHHGPQADSVVHSERREAWQATGCPKLASRDRMRGESQTGTRQKRPFCA